jgi:hypothetical protein
MLLTTHMAFMPSLKAHRVALLYSEVGAAMERRASQEMGMWGHTFKGVLAMQTGDDLGTFYQAVLETWKGKA